MNWTQEDLDALGSDKAAPQHKLSRARGVSAAADRTYNSIVYHSKSEAEHAIVLDFALRAGQLKSVARQVPIPLVVNNHPICRIVVDFEVEHLDGSRELFEVKGHATEVYKIKRKLFDALYPDRKYTVVKV